MSPGEESSERRLSERVGTNIEDWRIVGEMVAGVRVLVVGRVSIR